MISFGKLGEYGRLGNQLFQYAYLRTQAKRLTTKFYCPAWIGETIFNLNDAEEKCEKFVPESKYVEDTHKHGFSKGAVEIQDNTDVAGYFQSWKFFKKEEVCSWFSFKEETFKELRDRYKHIDFSNATALHVRLGDYMKPSLMFYTPTPKYFKQAIDVIKPTGRILVFSENAEMAKKYLGSTSEDLIFVDGNKDYEDFYLISLCRNIVCSPSSFSWWAAYLSKHEDGKVVAPIYWFIPYSTVTNNDIFIPGWIRLSAHRLVSDNYYVRYIRIFIQNLFSYKN